MNENFTASSVLFSVRPIEARDREAVLALWPAAIMPSQPGSETIDALIDSVEGAIAGKGQAWVTEASGRIIGSVAVTHSNASLAHLRHLCVAPDIAERHVVARGLAETAIRDAWERGYLMLVVHTTLPPSRFSADLHDLGFEFYRERSLGGEHVLQFLLNLYTQPRSLLSQGGSRSVPIAAYGSQRPAWQLHSPIPQQERPNDNPNPA